MFQSVFGFVPLVVYCWLTSSGTCQFMDFSHMMDPMKPSPMPKLKLPPTLDCMGFPGTLQWNKCWEKFHSDMANFQQGMQEYSDKIKKQNMKPNSTNGDFYSFNSMNMNTNSFQSTATVNGYRIQTSRIPVSTQVYNNNVQIIFPAGVEPYETKMEGQVLDLVFNSGQKKASINIPSKVKMEQIKIEHKGDVVIVSGPSGTMGMDYPAMGKFPQMPGMPMPPNFPMPSNFPMPQMPVMPFQFPNFRMNFPHFNGWQL